MNAADLNQKLFTPDFRAEQNGGLSILIDTHAANWIGVNDLGKTILSQLNGKSFDDLIDEFGKDFENKNVFNDKLRKFLTKCGKRGFLFNARPNGKAYAGRDGKLGLKSLHEMWIITNFNCNLRCKHCYTMERVNAEQDMLPADSIKSIVDEARALGTEIFYFTGGEPLMRNDILELIEYVAKRSKLILFTNGTLITEELAKEFAKFKERLIVQISLEGHNEEFNSIIRNKGMFERALNGVKNLLNEGIMVGVSTTPVTATKESVPKLTRLLGELSVNGNCVKYHHLIYLICFGNALKYSFTTLSSDELSEVFGKCCAMKKELKKKKINKTLKITNEKIFDAYATNGPKKDLCGAGYTILAIDNMGNLFPCASTISELKYSSGSLVDDDGNYVPGKLKDLWHGSDTMKRVRSFSIMRQNGEPKNDLRFFHGGGCWYNMKDPTGPFSTEHFFAETYEEKTLEAIKKAAMDDLDDDDISDKYPKLYSYMSRNRIACAGMRKTDDMSDDGLDLGYCICFS